MTIDKELRQNRVLEAIVKAHIASAFPVGSKEIARILGLSSATIRNVMFELETKGYIKQPYTSAGRVPTDLGYRRYVDNISYFENLERDHMLSEIRQYIKKKKAFEEVIEAFSYTISRVTKYTGFALSPNSRLYFGGAYHMLEHPEFSELGLAREFLKAIEEKEEFMRMMSEDMEKSGTTIRIGRENIFEHLKGCAIVTCTYNLENRIAGKIGLIGPMRMRYETVVPLVEGLAEMTTNILEETLC